MTNEYHIKKNDKCHFLCIPCTEIVNWDDPKYFKNTFLLPFDS